MYVIDARRCPNEKVAIARRKGAARAMAEFCGALFARAAEVHDLGMSALTCFRCRKATVQCGRTDANAFARRCDRRGTEGEISHGQGTLWGLRRAGGPAS